jgi:adenosine deaminase
VTDYARSMDGLAELHTHLGGSVSSDILWSLAHRQGIALPVKDYWDFDRLVTVSDPRGVADLDALDQIYHWTELIQSSPAAVEVSVHGAIGGAYRSQGITTLELRFNPMKRNRGGERDLDHIILAATRGLDVASLEYPQVRAGLILMMDRTFTPRQNEIIVEKAIRWSRRGIVGIDIAGPRPGGERYEYSVVQPMVEEARAGRGGARAAAPGPDRPRDPCRRRPRADARAPGSRGRAGDLPDLEPAHKGAGRRR